MAIASAAAAALLSLFNRPSTAQWWPSRRPSTLPPATAPATLPASSNVLTDERIVAAMKRGADYLLANATGDNWEEQQWREGQHGGETALVLYALLTAGQSLRDDPDYGAKLSFRGKELSPAVTWLCKANTGQTYAAALQANALALVPFNPGDKSAPNPRPALQRDYTYLATAMGTQGGYTYSYANDYEGRRNVLQQTAPIGDLSNSQYGALGMWALADSGIQTPIQYWRVTDRFWRLLQSPTGSWSYSVFSRMGHETNSMGVAGIASILVAQEFIDTQLHSAPLQDASLALGFAWLNQNFNADTGDLYYMYGVERVGLASGMKFFGTADWYRQGAANIVAHQNSDGSWDQGSWPRTFIGATPITSTSYALLFLARGRNPILFNKLEYDGPWNARARDDANLTRYMSKRFERPLNWQSVNLKVNPKEWMDAPILLITGSRDPKFTAEDIDKIRAYIEAGGMVFSVADEGNAQFTNSMRKYAGQVSHGRYEMRQLPPTHLLYQPELGANIASKSMLLGMSNGIRELWVHSTADMGASWQLQRTNSKDHFEIPAALYFYATGKSPLRARLKTLDIPESPVPPAHTLSMARIMFSGNSDPEPGAWPRLAKLLRNPQQPGTGIDLDIKSIPPADLDPRKYPLAHMTGTAKFLIKPEDLAAWSKYLDNGGLLLADAGGGSTAFTESFWQLIGRLYPDAKPTPLPPDHPIFTGKFKAGAGPRISEVELRKFAALSLGKRMTEPVIQAITIDGRIRVLFSATDISSGLLGTSTWGIVGYVPEDSQKLAENIVRWSIEQRR